MENRHIRCIFIEANNTIEIQESSEKGSNIYQKLYWVDLDNTAPAQIADTIFHVTQKVWFAKNPELLSEFLDLYREKMQKFVYNGVDHNLKN